VICYKKLGFVGRFHPLFLPQEANSSIIATFDQAKLGEALQLA
jgi:hypothetical protein